MGYNQVKIENLIYPYYYYYFMEKEETHTEMRQIRADNTIMLGLKMVGKSGLQSEENVKVVTKTGSGKIVIERMKKEEEL